MPDGTRKALNPSAPASSMAESSSAFSGTIPPHTPKSTRQTPSAAATFASRAATVVVTGSEFSGMSTIVVVPPAAAAFPAVSNPSQSARPWLVHVYVDIDEAGQDEAVAGIDLPIGR